MIGSNNYLGLTHHPHVTEGAIKAVERFGAWCTGSRFLNGTLELHEELERRLAKFFRKEACLCFTTGFQTNLGVISSLAGKNDVILCDRENHASIIDGCRLSFADLRKFKHGDMEDLERHLDLANEDEATGKLIIVDGVFSMMGDLANLPEITRLAKKYGARVIVDDAHGVGVMGGHGRGTAEHFGVEDEVDLILGTFSKSFASIGGFVAGPESVIHYIKHHARSMIFAASMPPACAGGVLAALEVIEREPERRRVLWENAETMRRAFRDAGFDTGVSETPIIPLVIGDQLGTFRFWKELFDGGVFANPITSPAVPPRMDLIRTSYMATHTPEQMERVIEIVTRVGRKLSLVA
jgi:8-amino-7-oxononanoate synthase